VDRIIFVSVRTFEEQSAASTARIGPTSSLLLKVSPRHRARSCVSGPTEAANSQTQFVDTAAPANRRPHGHVTIHHLNVVRTARASGPSLALEAWSTSSLGLVRGRLAAPQAEDVRCAVPQPSDGARAAPPSSNVGRAAPQPSDPDRGALQPSSVCGAHAYGPRVQAGWRDQAVVACPIDSSHRVVSHCVARTLCRCGHAPRVVTALLCTCRSPWVTSFWLSGPLWAGRA